MSLKDNVIALLTPIIIDSYLALLRLSSKHCSIQPVQDKASLKTCYLCCVYVAVVKQIPIRGCSLFEERAHWHDTNSLIKQCKSNPDKATMDEA